MELCIVIFLYFFLQFSFKISSNVAFCELNTVYFPLVTKGVLTKGCCCFFFSRNCVGSSQNGCKLLRLCPAILYGNRYDTVVITIGSNLRLIPGISVTFSSICCQPHPISSFYFSYPKILKFNWTLKQSAWSHLMALPLMALRFDFFLMQI